MKCGILNFEFFWNKDIFFHSMEFPQFWKRIITLTGIWQAIILCSTTLFKDFKIKRAKKTSSNYKLPESKKKLSLSNLTIKWSWEKLVKWEEYTFTQIIFLWFLKDYPNLDERLCSNMWMPMEHHLDNLWFLSLPESDKCTYHQTLTSK